MTDQCNIPTDGKTVPQQGTLPEHSPGPWRLNWSLAGGGQHPDYPELHYVGIQAAEEPSATSLHVAGYLRKPDAHLIGAAPELLEALKLLWRETELSGNSNAKDYGWPKAREATLTALAKAEGRSHG